jgi:hypothetical protein
LSPEAAATGNADAATESETETASDPTQAAATGTHPEQGPDPSHAVHALAERLAEGGMATEIEADGQTVRASKLGETYRVQPGEVVEGDGALRSRLSEIAEAAEQQEQATN